MSARIAGFFMASQRAGATGRQVLDRSPLFAAEHACVLSQELGADRAQHVADLRLAAGYGISIAASASKGLVTELIRSIETAVYKAVVFRLRCPRRTWIVRRSTPASSRCVAKLCRRVWTVTCFFNPDRRSVRRQDKMTLWVTSGLSVWLGNK